MRKVWTGSGPDIGGDILNTTELGSAPLALVVEHLPPKGKEYRLKVRIVPRDGEVLALMKRHHLLDGELFVDERAKAVEKEKAEIRKAYDEGSEKHGAVYGWSFDFWATNWRGVKNLFAEQKAVRMTVEAFLHGMEIKGKCDEIRWLTKQIAGGVDRLAAELSAGKDFDGGEITVFVPGAKMKPGKKSTGTKPSNW